jgi:hypothetical protein
MAISDHKSGGAVAEKVREQLGLPVRKSRASEPEKIGGRSTEFAAALSQAHRKPGSVPVGESAQIAEQIGKSREEARETQAADAGKRLVKQAAEAAAEDGSADPLQVLQAALARLEDAFTQSEGRKPGSQDKEFWAAYKRVMAQWTQAVKRGEA